VKKPKLITRKGLITIDAVPHKSQRYPSWGDWIFNKVTHQTKIKMSALSDWRYLYLGAIHELIEVFYCACTGVTQKQVDDFDFDYERRRVAGKQRTKCGCPITEDPGSDVHAPYFAAHEFASECEYKLADKLGIDRAKYDAACAAETEPFEKEQTNVVTGRSGQRRRQPSARQRRNHHGNRPEQSASA
jgi:hypothetical protein